jgi:DNA-binding XRE family transcriptional regulator
MQKETFGSKVASLRKEKGMTQLELAQKMGVTDKAVSKWERDLSLPDVSSLPRLAEVLDVSVEELLQAKTARSEGETSAKIASFIDLALKAVALAMGVAVAVLAFLGQVETGSALAMLGIGLACLAIVQLSEK